MWKRGANIVAVAGVLTVCVLALTECTKPVRYIMKTCSVSSDGTVLAVGKSESWRVRPEERMVSLVFEGITIRTPQRYLRGLSLNGPRWSTIANESDDTVELAFDTASLLGYEHAREKDAGDRHQFTYAGVIVREVGDRVDESTPVPVATMPSLKVAPGEKREVSMFFTDGAAYRWVCLEFTVRVPDSSKEYRCRFEYKRD